MGQTSSYQASTESLYSTSSTSFHTFPYHFSVNTYKCKIKWMILVKRLTCVFLGASCLHSLSGLKNRTILLFSRAQSHPLFRSDLVSFLEEENVFCCWIHFLNVPCHTRQALLWPSQCYGYLVTDATPGFPSTSTAAMEWPIRGQCGAVLTNERLPHKVIEMSISCQVLMRVRS